MCYGTQLTVCFSQCFKEKISLYVNGRHPSSSSLAQGLHYTRGGQAPALSLIFHSELLFVYLEHHAHQWGWTDRDCLKVVKR